MERKLSRSGPIYMTNRRCRKCGGTVVIDSNGNLACFECSLAIEEDEQVKAVALARVQDRELR